MRLLNGVGSLRQLSFLFLSVSLSEKRLMDNRLTESNNGGEREQRDADEMLLRLSGR